MTNPHAPPSPAVPAPPSSPSSPAGYHVLVVDDSAVMRAMVTRTLRLCGLPVAAIHEAANGQQGLTALWNAPVDLALVDLNMPVMTGEEMIAALRADPATAALPVIVVSTESSDIRIQRLMAQHVAFVHKPFTPEQLRDVILKTMGAKPGVVAPRGPSYDDRPVDATEALAGRAASDPGIGSDLDF